MFKSPIDPAEIFIVIRSSEPNRAMTVLPNFLDNIMFPARRPNMESIGPSILQKMIIQEGGAFS